jgi:hypothetical protein
MKTPISPATRYNDRSALWQERLTRYTVKSKTIAAFCGRESISVASFYLLRKRSLASPDGAVDAKRVSAASSHFIDHDPVTKHESCVWTQTGSRSLIARHTHY